MAPETLHAFVAAWRGTDPVKTRSAGAGRSAARIWETAAGTELPATAGGVTARTGTAQFSLSQKTPIGASARAGGTVSACLSCIGGGFGESQHSLYRNDQGLSRDSLGRIISTRRARRRTVFADPLGTGAALAAKREACCCGSITDPNGACRARSGGRRGSGGRMRAPPGAMVSGGAEAGAAAPTCGMEVSSRRAGE